MRCRNYVEKSPRGVHLIGFPHVEADGRAHTAFTFTSERSGRLISGYYADDFARGEDGRLLFLRREVAMPVTWIATRA